MQEVWKSIEGYEGKYEISSLGRVKSLTDKNGKKRELILKPRVSKNGYLYLNLWESSKGRAKKIHRLVAEAFLPNPENLPVVNHLNCVKTDNRVENLEWTTHSGNALHASQNGRLRDQTGEKNHMFGRHGKDHHSSKTLIQKDLDGNIIRVWDNAVIAGETLGYYHGCLQACARGAKKTAYGYLWEYAEVNENA